MGAKLRRKDFETGYRKGYDEGYKVALEHAKALVLGEMDNYARNGFSWEGDKNEEPV